MIYRSQTEPATGLSYRAFGGMKILEVFLEYGRKMLIGTIRTLLEIKLVVTGFMVTGKWVVSLRA